MHVIHHLTARILKQGGLFEKKPHSAHCTQTYNNIGMNTWVQSGATGWFVTQGSFMSQGADQVTREFA